VYPQFSLKCINRLEHVYLGQVKWDLYISASLYAKYYFALRSLAEGRDFRRRYNYVMQVQRLPNGYCNGFCLAQRFYLVQPCSAISMYELLVCMYASSAHAVHAMS
jgi:hypothetical protein